MLLFSNCRYLYLKRVITKKKYNFLLFFHASTQGYPPLAATTTTTTTTTTPKPIILVEKSMIAPFGEIPSPLMQLNEIPNEKTKGELYFHPFL